MPSEIKKLFLTVIISILFIGCNGGKMEEQKIHNNVLENIPASTWEKLVQKKIFFGHQSVGNNILDGIRDLMKENPRIKLNIIETNNPTDFNAPLFAHARVGKNRDPRSKIDAFANFIDKGIGIRQTSPSLNSVMWTLGLAPMLILKRFLVIIRNRCQG